MAKNGPCGYWLEADDQNGEYRPKNRQYVKGAVNRMMPDTRTVNGAEYTVNKLLGKGKGGYSYAILTLLVLAAFYGVYFAKDKTELVTTGIYRFSRTPAFLGFDLMYVGVLLLYGNLLTLGFSVFAIVMLHSQILQEERCLVNTFGAPYQEYYRHVSRYLGKK